MSKHLRIVIGSRFLAGYPQGGGHWSAFLQHLLGLRALGHEVFWLEILGSGGAEVDEPLIRQFGERMRAIGCEGAWAIGCCERGTRPDLDDLRVSGVSSAQLAEIVERADLLWNMAFSFEAPLLLRFRQRALIDLDPGVVQGAGAEWGMPFKEHQLRFTVGLNVGAPDCLVPTLGLQWRTFRQIVHLPLWPETPLPDAEAPITSVTQWNWGEHHSEGRRFSLSKREAYLDMVNVPRRAQMPFVLAANIGDNDPLGDRAALAHGGWTLIDPHRIADSPETYRKFIADSRAEFCCPKPIYVDMRTGWHSDRSVAYLALGRPVIMRDTGLARHVPIGDGLLVFHDEASAVEAAHEVVRNYAHHAKAARRLAQDFFSAERVLPEMLAACST